MFSCLSPGALGLTLDHTTSIDLAVQHGFGGVDPDPGHFRTLLEEKGLQAVVEHGDAVKAKGLSWGISKSERLVVIRGVGVFNLAFMTSFREAMRAQVRPPSS